MPPMSTLSNETLRPDPPSSGRTLVPASSSRTLIAKGLRKKRSEAPSVDTHFGEHIESGRLQGHSEDAIDGALNEVELEKPFDHDPWLVVFSPEDPENPKNWSRIRRWVITGISSMLVLNSTLASAASSGIVEPVIAHFHVSLEVGVLTVSLFVAGYCFGPLLWGPLSEQASTLAYGRRPVFLVAFTCYTGFQVGCALAPNTAALLIFRLLSGAFAACPLTNSGAVIADIWDVRTRGKAMALFCLAPFAGPSLGPAVGGFIAASGASWRWLYWALTCFSGSCLFAVIFFSPETYAPVILLKKARKLRKETGEKRYYAAIEKQDLPFLQRVRNILGRPFVVLFSEPMLMAITVYMAFVYGCIYILFEAYPLVFGQGHNMNAGISGLMFIPILVGAALAVVIYLVVFEPIYLKRSEELKPLPVPPEERLAMALWSGPFYVVSFFWFGWTSYPSISFWAPMMSGLFTGASVVMIFLSLINYTVDAYLAVSASALASSTVVRSMAGAGFPLFAGQMYAKLNPRWASTLLGFVALLLAPIPFILVRYGPRLRMQSKYAPTK